VFVLRDVQGNERRRDGSSSPVSSSGTVGISAASRLGSQCGQQSKRKFPALFFVGFFLFDGAPLQLTWPIAPTRLKQADSAAE
jgi:hypothetical protein